MIKIFKNIRKKMAAENKVSAYLRYAIGEILLVVIGILIALQVNNWNEHRKEKKHFDFGMNEFYKQMQMDVFTYSALIDHYTYQISKMDSIIYGKVSMMNIQNLPGTIQIFDDNGFGITNSNSEWQQNFLKLNPDDEKQNQMVRTIRKYFADGNYFQKELGDVNMDHLMFTYLRKWNIPVRFLNSGTAYSDFITQYFPSFYSKTDLTAVLQLTKDKSFLADLKSLRDLKFKRIYYANGLRKAGQAGLNYLKQVYPNIKFGIDKMEIVGSATSYNDWSRGIAMKKKSKDDSTWEITIDLTDGGIKFRTDAAWTFDWGQGQSDPTKLVFRGANIPVTEGKYHVTINIAKNTFKLIRINN